MGLEHIGSSWEILQDIYAQVIQVLAGVNAVHINAPNQVILDENTDVALVVTDSEGELVSKADITPGTITIKRIRAGATTTIVDAAACLATDGRAYYQYSWPNASWAVGDAFICIWSGVSYVADSQTYDLDNRYYWGRVTSNANVSADVATIKSAIQHPAYGLSAIHDDVDALGVLTGAVDRIEFANGVPDGNFSRGDIDGWAALDGAATLSYDASTGKTANGSLKVVLDTATNSGAKYAMQPYYAARGDSQARASIWVYQASGDAKTFRASLVNNDPSETHYQDTDVPSGAWTEVELDAITWASDSEDGETTFHVALIAADDSTTFWVDDVTVDSYCPSTAIQALEDVMNADRGSRTFDPSTDSLEALRNYLAASIAKTTDVTGAHATTDALITTVDAVVDSISTLLTTVDGKVDTVDTVVDAIKAVTDLFSFTGSDVKATLGGETVEITGAKSQLDDLNDLSAAQVNAEVNSALNTAVSEPPTAKSLHDILHKDGLYTFDKAIHSLEAIAGKLSDVEAQNGITADRNTAPGTAEDITTLSTPIFTKEGTAPWEFLGGWMVFFIPSSTTLTISIEVKLYSGDSWREVSTVDFADDADGIYFLPAQFPVGDTANQVVIPSLWNTYGVRVLGITDTGTATEIHEFFYRR